MPYCSIEEAWGSSFGKKPAKTKKYKIEADELAYNSMTPKLAEYPNHNEKLFEKSSEKIKHRVQMPNKINIDDFSINMNAGTAMSDDFIEEIYSKNDESKQYSLENASECNLVSSNEHLQNQYRKYIDYIAKLEKRIKHLENQLDAERRNNKKNGIYNIVLYIFAGIFIIFLLDCFVRLGKCLNTHGGLGATLRLSKEAAARAMPQNLPMPSLDGNYFKSPLNQFRY